MASSRTLYVIFSWFIVPPLHSSQHVMIPVRNRSIGFLSVTTMVLVLQACTVPGGVKWSNADKPVAKDTGIDASVPKVYGETVKPVEVGPAGDATTQGLAPGGNATDPIAPGDLLEIEVAQADELSTEGRVSEGGSIQLPLIGAVQVGGLTPKEAERHIADVLGKEFLQDPEVSIAVVE